MKFSFSFKISVWRMKQRVYILEAESRALLGMLMHACNPTTWEVDARGSVVQEFKTILSKFEASLGYTSPCLGKKKEKKKRKERKQKRKIIGYWARGRGREHKRKITDGS